MQKTLLKIYMSNKNNIDTYIKTFSRKAAQEYTHIYNRGRSTRRFLTLKKRKESKRIYKHTLIRYISSNS